jgi:hypothetical protein
MQRRSRPLGGEPAERTAPAAFSWTIAVIAANRAQIASSDTCERKGPGSDAGPFRAWPRGCSRVGQGTGILI